MSTEDLKVESELYREDQLNTSRTLENSNRLTKLVFTMCPLDFIAHLDSDGDLLVPRKQHYEIEIEHSSSTTIPLVGLQLWRGALILGDFVLHNGPSKFIDKTILELGSGVGLTSIIASMFAKETITTDVPLGGILDLIKRNIKRNHSIIKSRVSVISLNFYDKEWSQELQEILLRTDIVLAADVIYDDKLTEAFVLTLSKILSTGGEKTVYVALEKRYVFTIEDLDTVAPCYEFFIDCLKKTWVKPPMVDWSMKQLDIDFPQYLNYERNKHIVLWEIKNH